MGNSIGSKVNQDQVLKEVKEYPVVMYTKPNCGYCKMAKGLLDEEKILFKEKDLNLIEAMNPEGYQVCLLCFRKRLIYETYFRLMLMDLSTLLDKQQCPRSSFADDLLEDIRSYINLEKLKNCSNL